MNTSHECGLSSCNKTKHFTIKSKIYTDNTLIRLIILSKNFGGLLTVRQPTHTASRLEHITQFYATRKSHYFPVLHFPVNTINIFSVELAQRYKIYLSRYIHFLSSGVLMTAGFPLQKS